MVARQKCNQKEPSPLVAEQSRGGFIDDGKWCN